jgi:hypothetical protein
MKIAGIKIASSKVEGSKLIMQQLPAWFFSKKVIESDTFSLMDRFGLHPFNSLLQELLQRSSHCL